MSDKDISPQEQEQPKEGMQLEGGTYEIIRNRLNKHGNELRERLNQLNTERKNVFGSIETKLLSTERISTDNNCVPRDMVTIGHQVIFGYNVHMGLKTETSLSDVFSIYSHEGRQQFQQEGLELICDSRFVNDFKNLYQYYRHTVFVKFALIKNNLFMVFRVGKDIKDIKTFKWALEGGKLTYIDNRSDHEFRYPDQHEFRWKKTTRDQFREGIHPHISIEDRVFVETVGGDLTIKVEDNTATGQGIYAEPVDVADQTLDDAEVYYAILGNLIVLKMRPYQEKDFRYIVYNEKIQEAIRINALEDSCVLLPDDQGIIFAKGYYLQTGEFKLFDNQLEGMLFERRIASPNGEDHLYSFYNRESGTYILLSYNMIEQKVATPIICNGFSFYDDGEMNFFRADGEQKKHHVVQVWQTPYIGPNYELPVANKSFLFKIGNKDIVRAMAECTEILNLIEKEDSYANLYIDLVKLSTDVMDTYHWLDNEEAFLLAEPLSDIKESSSAAIEEYEKVVRVKKNTRQEVDRVSQGVVDMVRRIKGNIPQSIDDFVLLLADLRVLRGEVISLRDLRYVDLALVDQHEKTLSQYNDQISKDTVNYLLREDALQPYEQKVENLKTAIDKLSKVVEANETEEQIKKVSGELEMLIEIVSNLKIEDATQTTRIIDNISAIYSNFNQINAALRRKRKDLLSIEGKAEFNAQLKLINQGVTNYLDISETPEKCDEYLNKLMVQLEELEGKFAEFEEFLDQIHKKREEVYNAFESKKVQLVEARNKRSNALEQSADRILKGIANRLNDLETVSEINGYFAADLMVDKVRDIIKQLIALEDNVRSDALQSRLKTVKEDAIRQLKDKTELFVDGENIIKFGKHPFSVNTLALDLTSVFKNGDMYYHLTGTNFFEKIKEERLEATRPVWEQSLISENREVYRGEFLAYSVYAAAKAASYQHKEEQDEEQKLLSVEELQKLAPKNLGVYVQQYMAPRFNEGYVKGVHDQDATKILTALISIGQAADLLRFSSEARASAMLWWKLGVEDSQKTSLEKRLNGLGVLMELFPDSKTFLDVVEELQEGIHAFAIGTGLFKAEEIQDAGEYLFLELTRGKDFVIDNESADLYERFTNYLKQRKFDKKFDEAIKALEGDVINQFKLIRKWLVAFRDQEKLVGKSVYIDETATLLLTNSFNRAQVVLISLQQEIEGMQGSHNLIDGGKYVLYYNHFMQKMRYYVSNVVPMFETFTSLKKDMIDRYREELRLNEFKPRVMTSFIRNRLIDEVYLPIIGDNLAKQIGTAGENKRTDLMGMLLLISPPGYGKTTLMEYIANRLGVIFMKVNGPAIGHHVTSLDPAEAPNAAAREELEKLNLGFEMGDNIMLYLDDIQHCNPEFLQKFISLCDAQRKIEGVFKGRTKTYDLRGKKVCVVMAGNPYTESGEKFKIPDMLANRADIYNLGDILGDSEAAFKQSYIENSLTSNPVLSRLSNKSIKDVYTMLKLASTGNREGLEFETNHSAEEVEEYVSVMQKLITIRDVILKVNMQYIYSAAQQDEYRTEPAFKLQGSYRDMNKIASKVVPVMNEKELQTLILSHYESESQTLTTGAEANFLKFKEMYGVITEEESKRWEDIKATFRKHQARKGFGDDNKVSIIVEQMESISQGLKGIGDVLIHAIGNPLLPAAEAPEPVRESHPPEKVEVKRETPPPAQTPVASAPEAPAKEVKPAPANTAAPTAKAPSQPAASKAPADKQAPQKPSTTKPKGPPPLPKKGEEKK